MEVPPTLTAVLHKWKEVRGAILDLLSTANPNAIDAADLNLALLQRDQPKSRIVIERYRTRYGSMIEPQHQSTLDTVQQIDREVERLLSAITPGGAKATLPRSNIVELCSKLAEQLSGLKDLASLGESDG